MSWKHILVYVDEGCEGSLTLAASLAKKHGAALTACHVVSPLEPAVYGSSSMFGTLADKHNQLMLQKAEHWQGVVQSTSKKHALPIHWRQLAGRVVDTLATELMYYDLLVTSSDSEGLFAPILGGALIASGCPALITPRHWKTDELGEHVLVAWEPDIVANHAVFAALPLLQKASSVGLIHLQQESVESAEESAVERIKQRLSEHGVNASAHVVPKGGRSTAQALKAHFDTSDADLLVLGCYGHRRIHEWFFGGVTQDLLMKLPMPLLLTH